MPDIFLVSQLLSSKSAEHEYTPRMKRCFDIAGKLLTLIVLSVALVAVSLAHKPDHAPMSPELAAFIDAGGSLSAMCLVDEEQDDGEVHDCDACRIVDGFALSSPAHAAEATSCTYTRKLQNVAKLRHHSKPLDPTRLTRAPPQA